MENLVQLGLSNEFEASLGCVVCGEGEHLVIVAWSSRLESRKFHSK